MNIREYIKNIGSKICKCTDWNYTMPNFKLRQLIIFSIVIILIGIVIYTIPNFINVEYYTNKESAFNAVQGLSYEDGLHASEAYKNKFFWIYNSFCQIWGFFIALILVLFIIYIINFYKKRKHYNTCKKIFIYIWINLSYILWAICNLTLYMNNLEKEVYDSCHDTLAIPLFQSACSYIYFSAIYYPLSNIIIFFTYNKKIKSIWIILALFFIILYLISNIYINFIEKFMIISILMNVINITWLILCINMLMIHLKQWEIQQIRF